MMRTCLSSHVELVRARTIKAVFTQHISIRNSIDERSKYARRSLGCKPQSCGRFGDWVALKTPPTTACLCFIPFRQIVVLSPEYLLELSK
jgi:hypothetical protein